MRLDIAAQSAIALEQSERVVRLYLPVQLGQGGGAGPEPLADAAVQRNDILGAGRCAFQEQHQLQLELRVRHHASGGRVC
jgi:hypothetical protein